MAKEIFDVAVVGAGPAGSYFGYKIGGKGLNTILFDDSHPREKPCGGGITSFARKKHPIIHKVLHLGDLGNRLTYISPKGVKAEIIGDTQGFTISRSILDKFLLDKAVQEGVTFKSERVVDFWRTDDYWLIKTNKGEYESKIIIGADGVQSLVRKKIISPIPKEQLGLLFGYYAKKKDHYNEGFKYMNGKVGYFYLFKRKDHVSVGVGTYLNDSEGLRQELDKFIKEYYPDLEIISEWSHLIPFVSAPQFFNLPCAGKDWLLIGDAAGHVDPITGEGILYAMWGAELAVKAILNGNPELYDNYWREEYGKELIGRAKEVKSSYNPLMAEFSVRLMRKSKTFAKIIWNLTQRELSIHDFNKELLTNAHKIVLEYLFKG
jgi:geranylgeranyl reductase family protein